MSEATDLLSDVSRQMDEIIRSIALPAQLRIAKMDVDAYHALAEPLLDEVFRERRFVPLSELFDREEMARANALDDASASGVVHRYGIWDGETLIGVYRGRQTDAAIYRMSVTAILPAWQRRGIYTALLDVVLEAARSVGFLQVESSHHADNNPVLIAKLAHGFVISGFEVSLRTGLMVTLVHRFSERARAQHRVNVSS